MFIGVGLPITNTLNKGLLDLLATVSGNVLQTVTNSTMRPN